MTDMKNSALLDTLLDYALNYGGEKAETVTAERFFVAVLDCMNGLVGARDEAGRKTLEDALYDTLGKHPRLRYTLVSHIRHNTASFADSLYMQKKTYEAKALAAKKGLTELPPEILAQCILEEPTAAIEDGMRTAPKKPAKETAATPRQPGFSPEDIAAIQRQLDQNAAGSAPREEAELPRPTPKPDLPQKTAVARLVEKVKTTQQTLLQSIYGQDNAVSVFTSGYFQAELLAITDKKRVRPSATFLFAGPPGVGKTFLAEKAAEVLGLPFMRFDMSEYADKEANLEFCGSDKVYKNSKEGNVTGFVAKNPKCVLLFDEIEKAHLTVIHLFLQMLDAGRLRDNYTDRVISFKDTILIFTTNAGKQLYENSESGDYSGLSRKVILQALQKDINPATGNPFFPGAICSRFASGNVVMFNHIAAHDLRSIAKREILRHAENFASEVGIRVDIDEHVYTALLFAEGGNADARMMRSRAESFFDDELFELFRMIASEKAGGSVETLERISVEVALPEDNAELHGLFTSSDGPEALLFASPEIAASCVEKTKQCAFLRVESIGEAAQILSGQEISFVLIDLGFGKKEDKGYLNIEDVESRARDFFRYIRQTHSDMPVYLLQTPELVYNPEEKLSFLRQGVRDVLALEPEKGSFDEIVGGLCGRLHQQKSMLYLAKANKVVTFETAQLLGNQGKHAVIRLFDFETSVAVDAEDTGNVLSSVSKPDVRFDQVIGAEDAKKELRYFVEYLKNPKKYLGTGVRPPKGVLLYGPPGTGKTMLAKAMASASDVTFLSAEGNQFLRKYVGEGPDKVHELFRTARKYAPAILFVDEIDAIAKERRGGERSTAGEETLTAFLTEMDGFKNDPTKPVFVLAATNFDVEPGRDKSLDPALMRRFDRKVYIDLPNREERIRYMRLKLSENDTFAVSEDKLANIAIRSTGMSLSELESVFELSLRTAIRDGDGKVTDEIFEEAFETYNGGEIKKWDVSQLERVARHEAGHAFLCWCGGETPSYVTVVARGSHGGYMQHADNEGKAIYTYEELLSRIRTSLGGRAAELVYYGPKDGVSTGASGDLQMATNLARQIVCTYGMHTEFGLAVIDDQSARMGEVSSQVRTAVNAILSEQMELAVEALRDNRRAIDTLVEQLISKNHLTGNEIREIFEKTATER